jgi:hypothetical protein
MSVSRDYSANLPRDTVQSDPGRTGASRLRRFLGLIAFMVVMLLMAEMLRMGARPHPHGASAHAEKGNYVAPIGA